MGRKIPGKKHRGVKDPEKQRNTRINSLKGKINAPPSNPDDQEVPHSVSRIAELKERAKVKGKVNRQQQLLDNGNKVQTKRKKKKAQVPFKQQKCETSRQFLHRVNRECQAVIQEKAFENKYGVDIKRDPNTGEVEKLVKRPKDELEELAKEARKKGKGKKGKKRKSATSNEPVLTKSQKRQKKLKEKKEKKLAGGDFIQPRDEVKFGEVVHAPPTLNVPRKAAKGDGAPRPGARNLLLKSVMQDVKSNDNKKSFKVELGLNKTANKVIDKSGKRKNLPNALRRRLDKQQAEIIDAYRTIKKQRNTMLK